MIGLPLHVPHAWPGCGDIPAYTVLSVCMNAGDATAVCECPSISVSGRVDIAQWCYPVRRLPGLTEEQRAGLLVLAQVAHAPDRIRALIRDGHEPNLRRQLGWLRIGDGEVFALQTLGARRGDPSYLALCRSVDEAVRLTTEGALVALNRWGKLEPIPHQGVYVVPNRLVGRVDEVYVPGCWQIMPEGVSAPASQRLVLTKPPRTDLRASSSRSRAATT